MSGKKKESNPIFYLVLVLAALFLLCNAFPMNTEPTPEPEPQNIQTKEQQLQNGEEPTPTPLPAGLIPADTLCTNELLIQMTELANEQKQEEYFCLDEEGNIVRNYTVQMHKNKFISCEYHRGSIHHSIRETEGYSFASYDCQDCLSFEYIVEKVDPHCTLATSRFPSYFLMIDRPVNSNPAPYIHELDLQNSVVNFSIMRHFDIRPGVDECEKQFKQNFEVEGKIIELNCVKKSDVVFVKE